MFQEVRSLPRVAVTTVAITSPKYLIPWQKVAPLNVSDRLRLHSRWFTGAALPVARFTVCSGRVCLSCKSGELTINLFCRHHGQQRTDGVVRRSCSGDIFLMCCKCWGWEEVRKRWSCRCFDRQALIRMVLFTFWYPQEAMVPPIWWTPTQAECSWWQQLLLPGQLTEGWRPHLTSSRRRHTDAHLFEGHENLKSRPRRLHKPLIYQNNPISKSAN